MQYTKPAFRNAAFYCHVFSRSLTLNPNPLLLVSPFRKPETFRLASPVSCLSSSSMAVPPSSLEKQFDDFRVQLEESGTLRERIRSVVSEIESSTRLIYATLLLVHQSRPTPGTTQHTMLLFLHLTLTALVSFSYALLGRFWVSLSCYLWCVNGFVLQGLSVK